ncbi:MAG: hypothetical protein ABWJ99_05795 [Caldimicrobium sp.]
MNKASVYLERLLRDYKSLLRKDAPKMVSEKKPVNLQELRELNLFPPIYIATVEEVPLYNERLFKCLVLTEEIELAYFFNNPLLRLEGFRKILVVLPIWIYLTEDFIYNYSYYICSGNFQKYLEYAERAIFPPEGTPQCEYLNLIMKRLAPYNTKALLDVFESLERGEELKLSFSEELRDRLYEEYAFLLAAKSKNVIKGPNFLGYVEEKENQAVLTLYLPTEFLGKEAKVLLKETPLFEGILESTKIVIEGLPVLADYSFLEEELRVSL